MTQVVFLNGGGLDYDFRIGGTTKTNFSRLTRKMTASIGTSTPWTLLELVDDAPYITIKNSTQEDSVGVEKSNYFQGKQSGTEVSTLALIEASHNGSAMTKKADSEQTSTMDQRCRRCCVLLTINLSL